jgi:hypothetical protein
VFRPLLVIIALLLPACTSAESEARAKAEAEAKDAAKCKAYGLEPGTLKYDDCMANLASAREQIDRTALAGRLQGKLPQQLPTQ